MQFYFAPMEGVTGSLYRRIHAQCFPGMDRYFIPFLEPREGKCFDGHDKRECDPEENRGIPVVPQLLTNRADRFLEGARRLADLGYGDVDVPAARQTVLRPQKAITIRLDLQQPANRT